jgi:hypothetical protein
MIRYYRSGTGFAKEEIARRARLRAKKLAAVQSPCFIHTYPLFLEAGAFYQQVTYSILSNWYFM